jgi:hypothetical protein
MRRLVAVLVASLLLVTSSGPVTAPPPSSAQPTVTAIGASSPVPSPSNASPSAAMTYALPSAAMRDPAQVFRPLVPNWRPLGPTVLAVTFEQNRHILVAIPIGPAGVAGPVTEIIDIPNDAWCMAADGHALAFLVEAATGTRIAVWDFRSAGFSWATELSTIPEYPAVWSRDGSWLYYTTEARTANLYRVRPDGADRTMLLVPENVGLVIGETPDRRALIWTRSDVGGSVEILDLEAGTSKHITAPAIVQSVRTEQPRLLVTSGLDFTPDSLVLWDDAQMTSRIVSARTGDVGWLDASWDPTGTRIAAVRFDKATAASDIAIVDPSTGVASPVPGTSAAHSVIWVDEGIIFAAGSDVFDMFLIPAGGGAPVRIMKSLVWRTNSPIFVRP